MTAETRISIELMGRWLVVRSSYIFWYCCVETNSKPYPNQTKGKRRHNWHLQIQRMHCAHFDDGRRSQGVNWNRASHQSASAHCILLRLSFVPVRCSGAPSSSLLSLNLFLSMFAYHSEVPVGGRIDEKTWRLLEQAAEVKGGAARCLSGSFGVRRMIYGWEVGWQLSLSSTLEISCGYIFGIE
jgi:hypothetical protein